MEKEPRLSGLTGREGEEFDFKTATEWTKNYRDRNPGEIVSQFFGREILHKLLDQPDCMGIRMYYSNDKPLTRWQRIIVAISNFLLKVIGNLEGKPHLILVGAVKDGSDILPGSHIKAEGAVPLMRTEMAAITTADATTSKALVVQIATPCPGSANCPKNAMSS
jgi:hypothetical protein